MITTPEQMREAAAQIADKWATPEQRTHGNGGPAAAIRAIPIAPQPVDDQAANMKRIAYKAGYVQAECGLPCPADIDAAFAAWLAAFSQPVAVTVKPLVWDDRGYEWSWWSDEYQIRCEGGIGYLVDRQNVTICDPFDTIEAAKAAAQADYEARILYALTIQPADPMSDPRVVALREALGNAATTIKNLLEVMATPDQQQCCDGRMCGCMGSTVYQEAEYYALQDVAALRALLATPLSPPAVDGSKSYQSRVKPWLDACFGPEIASDKTERNHRFLEEALELVQSGGCTASEAHQLVDYVYGRPVGEMGQEIGGVMNTLAALCLANGFDMHSAGEIELARVWTMVEKIRAKQAAKPKHSPLPTAVDNSPAPDAGGKEGV